MMWWLLVGCGLFGGRGGEGCEGEDCARAAGETEDVLELAGAVEDCEDGTDNDGDGLIDCEDGDCAEVCVESDCGDSVDDEGDGLTDCEDEDCWGDAECALTTSRVLGGSMSVTERYHYYVLQNDDSADRSQFSTSWASSVALAGVSGEAEVFSSGTGGWITCDWSFEAANIGWRRWRERYYVNWYGSGSSTTTSGSSATPIARTGFAIDSGCPVSSSAFLPEDLSLVANAIWANTVRRYYGHSDGVYRDYEDTSRSESGDGWNESQIRRSTIRWEISELEEGGTWAIEL